MEVISTSHIGSTLSENDQRWRTVCVDLNISLYLRQGRPMRLLVLRLLLVTALIALYRVSPMLGVVALSIGFGYLAGLRAHGRRAASRRHA